MPASPACCGREMRRLTDSLYACDLCQAITLRCPSCRTRMIFREEPEDWRCPGCGLVIRMGEGVLDRLAARR